MKKFSRVFEVMDSVENLNNDFQDIIELSTKCKFSNCTHTTESECAVKNAISEGILSQERYNNYYKLKNEAQYVSQNKNKTKAIDYMRKKKLFDGNNKLAGRR
jgi:Predicted GTPases